MAPAKKRSSAAGPWTFGGLAGPLAFTVSAGPLTLAVTTGPLTFAGSAGPFCLTIRGPFDGDAVPEFELRFGIGQEPPLLQHPL